MSDFLTIFDVLNEKDPKTRKKLANQWFRKIHDREKDPFLPYSPFKTDPIRHKSVEVNFGVQWHREYHKVERWRISWVEDTGELYAVMLGNTYDGEIELPCVILGKNKELKAFDNIRNLDFRQMVLEKVFPWINWGTVNKHIGGSYA